MSHQLATVLTWATIYQWLVIAALFFIDSSRVYIRARRQYRTVAVVGNGRMLVARRRRRIAFWFVLGSGLGLVLGILSAYQNAFLPHAPPDTRVVGAIVRQGIVIMFFAFWRAKRNNLALQHELDARRLREAGV